MGRGVKGSSEPGDQQSIRCPLPRREAVQWPTPANPDQSIPSRCPCGGSGNSPRHFQNTLVFLASNEQKLDNLFQALADRRAWQRVIHEKLLLQITVSQEKKAERKIDEATHVISVRVPETWCHLLVPYQNGPAPYGAEWDEKKLSGGKRSLAEHCCCVKRLGIDSAGG